MVHLESGGSGSDTLVLIHGWGLHGGVWSAVAAQLESHHRVVRVDLPGFGASAPLADGYSIDALVGAVAGAVPENAIWIGWSLGGLVAMAAAAHGVAIRKLVLVGATPRFTRAADWPHAMDPEVLATFAAGLEQDFRATVLRFLALQARGSERAREELRALRESVFARGEPAPAALRGGLRILRDADLRASLPAISARALLLHGERDVLVPVAAAQAAAAQMPHARLETIAGAGHAPFLSHPQEFVERLCSFVHE